MSVELLAIHGYDNEHRVGDIVFVHGLNGNAGRYWCRDDKPENYWPAWVGEDLPDVGVWSLGYENAAFKKRRFSFLPGYRGLAMPLSDRARSVLLKLEVAKLGERPLLFITHSMGGLLVKQLLRTANEYPDRKKWTAIWKNTRGVCFIATPHVGADPAAWAAYFRTLLGTNISTQELEPHGPLLRELNEFYRNFVNRRGVNIKTLSFFEKKPLVGNTLVVREGDADPGVPEAGLYPEDENHLSICKPRNNKETIHLKIIDFIKNDCFQPATQPPSPGQTDGVPPSPGKPPWRPDPIAAPKAWRLRLSVAVFSFVAVVVLLLYMLRGYSTQSSTSISKPTAIVPTLLILMPLLALASATLLGAVIGLLWVRGLMRATTPTISSNQRLLSKSTVLSILGTLFTIVWSFAMGSIMLGIMGSLPNKNLLDQNYWTHATIDRHRLGLGLQALEQMCLSILPQSLVVYLIIIPLINDIVSSVGMPTNELFKWQNLWTNLGSKKAHMFERLLLIPLMIPIPIVISNIIMFIPFYLCHYIFDEFLLDNISLHIILHATPNIIEFFCGLYVFIAIGFPLVADSFRNLGVTTNASQIWPHVD